MLRKPDNTDKVTSKPSVVDDYFITLFDLYLTKLKPKLPSSTYNVLNKCIINKITVLSSDVPMHRTREQKDRKLVLMYLPTYVFIQGASTLK